MKKTLAIIAAVCAALGVTITATLTTCEGGKADWGEVADKWGTVIDEGKNNDVSEPIVEQAE